MAATYEPIASQTLGSAATVTLSSIPSTYTDLRLIVHGRSSWATDSYDNLNIRFNGDSGNNYSRTDLNYGPHSARSSNANAIQAPRLNPSNFSNTNFSISIVDIFSYANTNVYKTVLASGSGLHEAYIPSRHVGLWRSTAAISSIFLGTGQGSTLAAGTVISLYGIKAA